MVVLVGLVSDLLIYVSACSCINVDLCACSCAGLLLRYCPLCYCFESFVQFTLRRSIAWFSTYEIFVRYIFFDMMQTFLPVKWLSSHLLSVALPCFVCIVSHVVREAELHLCRIPYLTFLRYFG